MFAIGLTGGIGAGKSTVASLLMQRGAELIDADRIAREVVEPGRPAYEAIVERFGNSVLAGDGTLDRQQIARLAFADEKALSDLNAITHPAIGAEMAARRELAAERDGVVIFDIPLLRPEHRDMLRLDMIVVVDAPVEVAIERLVASRGMDRGDAEARVASQIDRQTRRSMADVVIDNSGTPQQLAQQVDRLWDQIEKCARP